MMITERARSILLVGLLSACATSRMPLTPQEPAVQRFQPEQVNSQAAMAAPYVILVSIDGYRHDYNEVFSPPHLSRIAKEGVAAKSLKPVYPSKTFPNHYALVTGRYADTHLIVSNEFFDPDLGGTFTLSDRVAVEDARWYAGDPLWTVAQRQGMLSASFFWVGSEAPINGIHPNYYYAYDAKIPYEKRVDQVLAWLRLPDAQRPHFITLYFEGVDAAAHRFGILSHETRAAVAHVDEMIGRLRTGLEAQGLPVHLIVVSDHGMQDVEKDKVLLLDEDGDIARLLTHFRAVGRGPQMQLYLRAGEPRRFVRDLERALERLPAFKKNLVRVHRRAEMWKLHYDSTTRVGDLVIEPNAPYLVGFKANPPPAIGANHGWDANRSKAMHGIFYGVGPAFREGKTIPSFESVHVYPLILEILNLKTMGPVDGRRAPVQGVLRPPAMRERRQPGAG